MVDEGIVQESAILYTFQGHIQSLHRVERCQGCANAVTDNLLAVTICNQCQIAEIIYAPFRKSPEWYIGKDRKSTRLNSSHANISYAVFCLKKKKNPSHCSPLLPPTQYTPPSRLPSPIL